MNRAPQAGALPLENQVRKAPLDDEFITYLEMRGRVQLLRLNMHAVSHFDRPGHSNLETVVSIEFNERVGLTARAIMGRIAVVLWNEPGLTYEFDITALDPTLTRGIPDARYRDTVIADNLLTATMAHSDRERPAYVLLTLMHESGWTPEEYMWDAQIESTDGTTRIFLRQLYQPAAIRPKSPRYVFDDGTSAY